MNLNDRNDILNPTKETIKPVIEDSQTMTIDEFMDVVEREAAEAASYDDICRYIANFKEMRPELEEEIYRRIKDSQILGESEFQITNIRRKVFNILRSVDTAKTVEEALQTNAVIERYDYEIEDLVCPSVSRVIRDQNARASSDPLPLLLNLLTAVAGIVGSHLRMNTGQGFSDLPLNLNVLLVGDSSSGKSLLTQNVIKPLEKFSANCVNNKKQRLKAIELDKDLSSEDKRTQIATIKQNQRVVLADLLSFSGEGLLKMLAEQQKRAGLLLFRDEASDLLGHERYGRGGNAGNSTSSSLFKSAIMRTMTDTFTGGNMKMDSEKCGDYEEQTLSILGNIQRHYLLDLLNLQEDSLGWTSRWIVSRAKRNDIPDHFRTIRDKSKFSVFMERRVIPFFSAIKPLKEKDFSYGGEEFRDYINLTFNDDDGAQEYFMSIIQEEDIWMRDSANTTTEPHYIKWRRKCNIRIGKIAALLHALEMLEGKNAKGIDPDPNNPTECIFTFDSNSAFIHKKGAGCRISKENVERAYRIEQLLRDEFLIVTDQAAVAAKRKDQAVVTSEIRAKLLFILDKLSELSSESQRGFLARMRGGALKLSRDELKTYIDQLVKMGCIERYHEGRKLLLKFKKELR